MVPILRVARSTNDLKRTAQMYQEGLGFKVLPLLDRMMDFLGSYSDMKNVNFTWNSQKKKM